ncbi:DUF5765 domain-containing protein [Methylocucumis oryzae]|uniref:Uncharacterized protein n=1 Tax=Methylocucumis oryzae TaxID=1632867 RepID=A0A0F3IQB0_9GAMM|nr:DUF5765 domain-containing protein [Methylocucumis oryzae]KJV07769.1 hypothetical protein VZ94_02580 [Methylocucumis oryzae]
MCFSANMSLGFGVVGFIASGYTFLDSNESFYVRLARAYAIFHFSLMELIQYFAYPVADQCGYGTNLLLSQLSTYHISLQALAIMPALATYSTDKNALRKATMIGVSLSSMFLLFNFMPKDWQFIDAKVFADIPNFIGDMIACLYKGKYHIAYSITSAYGSFITWGSFFALAISGFLWQNNTRMASYHLIMAILTLYVPQWIFGVSTGEAAAIYCLYSIPITGSFMPAFKKFFTVKDEECLGQEEKA